MAKSLRSKSKRAFRRIKREDPKSDYAIRDRIRLQRLNEKLKVLTAVERSDDEGEGEGDEELEEQVGAGRQGQDRIVDPEISKDAAISTSAAAPAFDFKKISTAGPRTSARLEWKKHRGLPLSRKRTENNSTTFGHRKSYKSTGKSYNRIGKTAPKSRRG
ncbi:MAG: hypothetical protein CYPHOPRED_003508 [Cyphobasidiales sp. Tagirdzhanova-0007]|nr:MAG: hypothetical protein CYPHOPRED_003508 [Cyphobasidiales sp. Tagirdzhanova-0007]